MNGNDDRSSNGYLLASIQALEGRVDRLFEWQRESRKEQEVAHTVLLNRLDKQDREFAEIRIGLKWVRLIGCGVIWMIGFAVALLAWSKGDSSLIKHFLTGGPS